MSKEVLIQAIRRHNPTAAAEFLARFSDEALGRYLKHLQYVGRPRHTQWIHRFYPAASASA